MKYQKLLNSAKEHVNRQLGVQNGLIAEAELKAREILRAMPQCNTDLAPVIDHLCGDMMWLYQGYHNNDVNLAFEVAKIGGRHGEVDPLRHGPLTAGPMCDLVKVIASAMSSIHALKRQLERLEELEKYFQTR